jgi:aryl-alcohol dehydrogenase-like predicted oxidoreductase
MAGRRGDLDRRTFVKAGLGTVAGVAALGSGTELAKTAAAVEAPAAIGGMETVALPRTGFVTPRFALGGSAMGGYGLANFTMMTPERMVECVRHAYDEGVRYFDTAVSYRRGLNPGSEDVLGNALSDVRDKVFINTKTHARTPEEARRHIAFSLKSMKTDYVDCLKLHVPNHYDYAMRVGEELAKMKEEGLTRTIGVSNHIHFEVLYKLVDTGMFDEILIAKGYFPKGMNEIVSHRNQEFRELTLLRATELGMNIVGMKALCSRIFGHHVKQLVPDYPDDKAANLPAAAIRWALSDRRFHTFTIGYSYYEDVDLCLEIFRGDMTVTDEDRRLLAEFSTLAWETEPVKAYAEPYVHEGDTFGPPPPGESESEA